MVKKMAKTIRAARHFGIAHSLSASSSHTGRLFSAYRVIDCPHTPSFRRTESRFAGCTCDPRRTAQGVGQTDALVEHNGRGAAKAPLDFQSERGCTGLLSQASHGHRWHPACVGLDVSLSRRRSQGVCLSHPEPADAGCTQTIAADKSYETV